MLQPSLSDQLNNSLASSIKGLIIVVDPEGGEEGEWVRVWEKEESRCEKIEKEEGKDATW